jgi:hypothetical protein
LYCVERLLKSAVAVAETAAVATSERIHCNTFLLEETSDQFGVGGISGLLVGKVN